MAFHQTRSGVLAAVRVGAGKLPFDRISIESGPHKIAGKGTFLVTDKALHRSKESDPMLTQSSKVLLSTFITELARDLISNVFIDKKKPYLIPKKE